MKLDTILVPVDGSEQSWRALEQATYMARICKAHIDILYVLDLSVNIPALDRVIAGGYIPVEIKEEAYLLLKKAAAKVVPEVEVCTFLNIGSPASTIIDFCAARSYDLIIMGNRGLGKIKQILIGSVSRYVLYHAKCTVLVVR